MARPDPIGQGKGVVDRYLVHNSDFLAGLVMLGIGALAFYMALDYPFGSAVRMGPGYFPRVLAVIRFAVF